MTTSQSKFEEPTKLFLIQLFMDMLLAIFGFLLFRKRS